MIVKPIHKNISRALSPNKKQQIKKHQEYAALSTDCKTESFDNSPADYKKLCIVKNPKTGFGASVYKNLNENEIIIAYRATNNQEGVVSDMEMIKGEIPSQYDDAIELYDIIKNAYPHFKISITGHSLGGSLAELVASSDKRTEAVTFDSFGTLPIVKSDDNQLGDNNNCTNYVTQNSIVSNVTPHVGQTKTIVARNLPVTLLPHEDIKNKHSMDCFKNLKGSVYSPEIIEEPKRKINAIVTKYVGNILKCHPKLGEKIPKIFFDKTPEMDYVA